MGVKGLTTFIDNNPILLQDYHLHGCQVIFDGNNFYHFLYHTYNLRQQFNGDYLNYAKKIKQVFINLKKCGIVPLVVFDGGYDTDDRKHQTVLERAKHRIRTSSKSSFRGSRLLPILAYETFRMVLDDLNVFHVTCDYEADEHIAILANNLQCPVISNDSDFYVYHIHAGFIPMDYVDFRIKHKRIKDSETGKSRTLLYILVQKYHHDNFKDVFGKFNPKFIPLLATILGNDFVNGKVFSLFMRNFKRPPSNNNNKKSKLSSKRSKAWSLISWFKRCGSVDEAVNLILDHFPPEKKEIIAKTIYDSMTSYTFIDTSNTYLLDYIEQGSSFQPKNLITNDYFKNSIPEWICSSLLKAEMSPFVQNALVLRRVILQCQVEEFRKPSSHSISKAIRTVIYGILFGGAGTKSAVDTTQGDNRNTHIEEYDRKTCHVGKTYTSPSTELPNFGPILDLTGLPIVHMERRRDLMTEVLSVSKEFVSQFCPSFQLLVSVTVFWARSSGIPKYHLAAFLLNVVLLRLIHFCVTKDKEPEDKLEKQKELEDEMIEGGPSLEAVSSPQDDLEEKAIAAINSVSLSDCNQYQQSFDFDTVFQSVPLSILSQIKRDLTKDINNLSSITWKFEWPPRLSHCYAQLQSCLLYAINLNQLLLCPLSSPIIPQSYDGSTLYLLSKSMQAKENILLYAGKVLCGNIELLRLFMTLFDSICKEVGEENFVETYTMKRRKKKEEKRLELENSGLLQSKSRSEHDVSEDDSMCSEEEEESPPSMVTVDCEITNRFSIL